VICHYRRALCAPPKPPHRPRPAVATGELARLALVALSATAACRGAGPGDAQRADVVLAGSTSMQPFAERWAQAFGRKNPGARLSVQPGGSTTGVRLAASGVVQIGLSSRALLPGERQGLQEVAVAREAIAVVVSAKSPVSALTLAEVRAVFRGEVASWRALGGRDRPITVITREQGSGTRGAFEELALGGGSVTAGALVGDSTGAVREMVSSDEDAIGYVSLGQVEGEVRALALDGVAASEESVVAGRYPLVRPFLMVTKGPPVGAAAAFIDFLRSPVGQALLASEGLIAGGGPPPRP